MDEPPDRNGRVVPATRLAAVGEEVLHEVDHPACCSRSARRFHHSFECPACGAVSQVPLPVEPEEDAFVERVAEERKGAA